ncbi:MAG: hypothetical protein RI925_1750 [Pseudomonadota bacterium]|jgi:aerotaxis receptor
MRHPQLAPVEVFLDPRQPIVTRTDLRGSIVYANPAFIAISGFSAAELIGQPHNIVRHPDMPKQAFADLWRTLAEGKPWRGMVKNRTKSGDFYWVEAYVTPVFEQGQHVGYMSVRTAPKRNEVADAERLYAEIRQGLAAFPATRQPWTPSLLSVGGGMVGCLLLAVLFSMLTPSSWLGVALLNGLALLAGVWMTLSVRQSLRQMRQSLRQFAEGNFRGRVAHSGPRECQALASQLESLRIHSRAMMSDVLSSSERLLGAVEQLGSQTHDIAERSQQQTGSVAQVAAALEELTTSVHEISAAAQQSAGYAEDSQQQVFAGREAMQASHLATSAVIDGVERARLMVADLQATSGQIGAVATLIEDVAEQTNLLALNAAIEAARAGEQGRGFAVVADEVRKLAERSARSVGDIRTLTQGINQRTNDAMGAIAQVVTQVADACGRIAHSADNLAGIDHASQAVASAAQEIALMVEQQSASAVEIASSMEQVNQMSEQNLSTVACATQATVQLRHTAQAMRALVGHFEQSL